MQTEFLSVMAPQKQLSISSMMMVILIISVTKLYILLLFSVLPGPTNLRSVSTASTNVTLTWDAPDSSSFSIALTGYAITILLGNSVQRTVTSVQLQYTIRLLVPFQEYQFYVRANFADGGRSDSISINVRTLEDGKLLIYITVYSHTFYSSRRSTCYAHGFTHGNHPHPLLGSTS